MPTQQHKNRIINSQDSMSPSECSDHTIVGPEKCNTAEAQDKVFKIVTVSMLEDLKDDMNKSLNEVCENTNA